MNSTASYQCPVRHATNVLGDYELNTPETNSNINSNITTTFIVRRSSSGTSSTSFCLKARGAVHPASYASDAVRIVRFPRNPPLSPTFPRSSSPTSSKGSTPTNHHLVKKKMSCISLPPPINHVKLSKALLQQRDKEQQQEEEDDDEEEEVEVEVERADSVSSSSSAESQSLLEPRHTS